MLLRGAFLIAGSGIAISAAAASANVQTVAESMTIGGEFRSELIYDDHGLEKAEGVSSKPTSNLQVSAAKVKFKGNLSHDTEYAFRFNVLNTDSKGQLLEYGYLRHWLGKSVGITFGKVKVMQGGFDNVDDNYRFHIRPAYRSDLVFPSRYEPVVGLHILAAGELSAYVINDVNSETNPNRWNERKNQTLIVGYRGRFGPIEPLLNYGSYDNNKSFWIDAGMKTNMAGLTASFDYWSDKEILKGRNVSDNSAVDLVQTSSNVAFNLKYEISNLGIPWVHLSKYDKNQADTGANSILLEFDSKTNGTTSVASRNRNYNSAPDNLDDNALMGGVGVDVSAFGKSWTPYVAILGTQAKFENNSQKSVETRRSVQIKVGVLGEI